LLVVLLWVALAVAGAATAHTTTSRLSTSFTFPGQAGYQANTLIGRYYHTGGVTPPVVVLLTAPQGGTLDLAQAGRAFAAANSTGPLRVLDYADTGDAAFVAGGGRATYALMFPPSDTGDRTADYAPAILGAVRAAAPPGTTAEATGFDQLAAGSKAGGVGVLAETVIGGVGALVVLAFLFASFLALLPLVVAIVSVLATFLLVLGLTSFTSISFIAEFLIALIGLGVAIDYSLLLATRWREERAKGAGRREAVENAAATAGRAVLFSGFAVAVGLASLIAVPVPFLRSLGYSGLLIPLVSEAVALTLLPIILYTVGDRLDWPRRRTERSGSRAWAAWTRGVVRYRWAALAVGLGILAALIVPFFSMHAGEASATSLAAKGAYRVALDDLGRDGIPTGVLDPIEVIVSGGAGGAGGAGGVGGAGGAVAAQLGHLPGVHAALAPSTAAFHAAGTAIVDVLPVTETGQSAGADTLARVTAAVSGNPAVLGIGGQGALDRDFAVAVYGHFALILAVLSVLTFLLLMAVFRSVLLALKAVVFNLASLGAAYGILTLIWQRGIGSRALFGVPGTGAITVWVPLIIFAFLFGLSMDYEVFILTRVREEHERLRDTQGAVIEGLARTGRLITGAALILFLAFLSLATAPATEVKMLGTALGAGILLDATVIRALLVPAVVAILGEAAWWLPGRRGGGTTQARGTRPRSVAARR
jgi:RND superfamily putative drug exporter